MTEAEKTCDGCKHYTPTSDEIHWQNCGDCNVINDNRSRVLPADMLEAGCEGGGAWVYVGPKFGCIHWSAKQ